MTHDMNRQKHCVSYLLVQYDVLVQCTVYLLLILKA